MRRIYNALIYASRAHAQWEIENSVNILKNRRKLLILLVLALPLLIPAAAHAASALPAAIGGKSAYGPSLCRTNYPKWVIFLYPPLPAP